MSRCAAEKCRNWTGDGCICAVLCIDPDVARDDPCAFCDHDVQEHRGDGCIECPCDMPT